MSDGGAADARTANTRTWIEGLHGVLLDVDGTLLVRERAVPGAGAAVDRLRGRGLLVRLTTNITRRSQGGIAALLKSAGFDVKPEEVLNPAALARRRILESGRTRAALLVTDEAKADFRGIEEDARHPQWVVLGDLGRGFDYDVLNRAFRWIRDGAAPIALHRSRFWESPTDGLVLDAGAFVAALEYATGAEAETVGKPSLSFFELALMEIGLSGPDVLVVGDDLENDCAGGRAAGCRTALVLTGKTGRGEVDQAAARPDLVLDSIASLG